MPEVVKELRVERPQLGGGEEHAGAGGEARNDDDAAERVAVGQVAGGAGAEGLACEWMGEGARVLREV